MTTPTPFSTPDGREDSGYDLQTSAAMMLMVLYDCPNPTIIESVHYLASRGNPLADVDALMAHATGDFKSLKKLFNAVHVGLNQQFNQAFGEVPTD